MDNYQKYFKSKLAAGGMLLLAAIFIIACEAESIPLDEITQPTGTVISLATPPLVVSPTPTHSAIIATLAPTKRPTTPIQPTATSHPTKSPPTKPAVSASRQQVSAGSGVKVSETTITLSTYPIQDYLSEEIDPLYNIPVLYFNRPEFEAAAPPPVPVNYMGVVLENAYVRLTFLPELGGRLYSAVVKSTGQEVFYHNPVVKPSRYGILQPAEANWWLATGGMEWAYPTQEHGYRWGVAWDYTIEQTALGATISLSDTAPDRVGAEVEVTLPQDSAAFMVRPKLINNTTGDVPVQFWLNAALTLGQTTMSPQTQFIVPVEEMVVHSRGGSGWTLPDARQTGAWPVINEKDLHDYNQWADYLGFFMPHLKAPFMAAYNPETNLGVVRLIKPGDVPGSKLFAFGQDFAYRDYTDDNSQYFEIWGGINTGFWPEDDVLVGPGEMRQWQESWWPVAGLDGLTWANSQAAIYLAASNNSYDLTLLGSHPIQGHVRVTAGEVEVVSEPVSLNPTNLLTLTFEATNTPVFVRLLDKDNNLLLEYISENK